MQTKLFRRDFTLVVIGQIISLFGNAILRFAWLSLFVTMRLAIFRLMSHTQHSFEDNILFHRRKISH